MKIVHCSDIHLGKRPIGKKEYSTIRYNDYFTAFENIVDYAIEIIADIFIISGDFFDRKEIFPEILLRAESILNRLNDEGIKIIMIEGNHDKIYSDKSDESWLVYLQKKGVVTLLETKSVGDGFELGSVKIEDVNFYGIGYFGSFTNEVVDYMAKFLENELVEGLDSASLVRLDEQGTITSESDRDIAVDLFGNPIGDASILEIEDISDRVLDKLTSKDSGEEKDQLGEEHDVFGNDDRMGETEHLENLLSENLLQNSPLGQDESSMRIFERTSDNSKNIILIHTAMGDGSEDSFFPGTVSSDSIKKLQHRAIYVAGGHFHSFSKYPAKAPFFFVPGSPEYWDLAEKGKRGFIVFDTDSLEHEFIESKKRLKLDIVLDIETKTISEFEDEFTNKIDESGIIEGCLVFLILRLKNSITIDVNKCEDYIESLGAIKALIRVEYNLEKIDTKGQDRKFNIADVEREVISNIGEFADYTDPIITTLGKLKTSHSDNQADIFYDNYLSMINAIIEQSTENEEADNE